MINAVIDVGSGTLKCLVAEWNGKIKVLRESTREVRLGVEEGCIPTEKFTEVFEAIVSLIDEARACGAKQIVAVATSAVRDASNQADFVKAFERATGVPLRVLSGQEEADAIGAGLLCDPDIGGHCVAFDIGGGSLERIEFDQRPLSAESFPLGVIRLARRFHPNIQDPLPRNAFGEIRALLKSTLPPYKGPLVFLSGSAYILLNWLQSQDASLPTNTLTDASLALAFSKIATLPLSERYKLPIIPKNRADVLPTSIALMQALMDLAGVNSVHCSRYNLKYGITYNLCKRP
ncbi:MAG: hypothetical protein A2Y14_04070 [Verrucomicrobia bacterium GWF2_51_19]|nr:MAG: hypothetical protein A2Y14_04070 [Verrucomicrobia bacterium GWF2_51_19]HCJ11536.1 hypothetical protein [Opitutae bacterium]